MRFSVLAAMSAVLGAGPVLAQPVSMEDLARRVEALERENAALRAQMQQLAERPAPAPPAHSSPEPVHGAPQQRVDPYAGEADEPWDSAYVGIHAGYARFRSTYRQPGFPSGADSADGYALGAQLGRRWQLGSIVIGAELEADFPQLPKLGIEVLPSPEPTYRLDLRARGRVKGQIGFASGPLLAYGTIGLEQALMRHGVTPFIGVGLSAPTQYERRHYTGFVLGLGGAYALGNGLFLELEGTRTSYGTPGARAGDITPASSHALLLRLNQAIP